MTVNVTFEPGCPRSRREAFEDRHVARRLAVDAADVIAGLQPGLRGRRAIARGDHAEVVLARQLQADVALGQRRARLTSATCCAFRYALSGSSPSASPFSAPSIAWSTLTSST